LKYSLRKVIDSQLIWSEKLNEIQYKIDNTYYSTIKCSSANFSGRQA